MTSNWIRWAVLSVFASWTSWAWCYQANPATRTVTVSPQASPAATTSDVNAAASYLRNRADQGSVWTWRFMPGRYVLTASIYRPGLKNVRLVSDPQNPAQLFKDASWNSSANEYLIDMRYCENLALIGFEIYGKTEVFPVYPATPPWGDQGVQFASCDTVTVNRNRFFNIGNGALRVTTMAGDPIKGVNSFNTVVTNNLFDNIYQITTTSNDAEHGGTANYRMANNVIRRLHGSVKFATRTAGARDVVIVDNLFDGSARYGLEINNYEKMEIRGNVFQDIASVAINIYTAGDERLVPKPFPWGSNFTITGNIIRNAGRGIDYRHTPFWDGSNHVPSNVVIENNSLDGIDLPSDPLYPAIYVTGSPINALRVAGNRFHHLSNGKMLSSMPSGAVVANNALLPTRATRDLSGNLTSELLWQNPANGAVAQWPLASAWSPGTFAPPAEWTIAVVGDIDGESRADLLVRNSNGQVAAMLGASPSLVRPLAALDNSWQLAASADVNGDGRSDLVWRNASQGIVVIWYMKLENDTLSWQRTTLGMDAAWQLITASDFDGDGKADILWREPHTANTMVWLMNGSTIKNRITLLLDATSYMVAAGDFDSDGQSEIVMRNPVTGLVTLVFGAASGQPRVESFAGPEPASWQTGAVGDFDGDGRTDIAWRHATTRSINVWYMNGSAIRATATFDGPERTWALIR